MIAPFNFLPADADFFFSGLLKVPCHVAIGLDGNILMLTNYPSVQAGSFARWQ